MLNDDVLDGLDVLIELVEIELELVLIELRDELLELLELEELVLTDEVEIDDPLDELSAIYTVVPAK